MPINFNSRIITSVGLFFLILCLANAGYFTRQKDNPQEPRPKVDNNYLGQPKYRVEIDPSKPAEERKFWEKLALMYVSKKIESPYPTVIYKPGDMLRVRVSEVINNGESQGGKELIVEPGQNQLPGYIEESLLFMEQGEKKEISVYDESIKKEKYITIELLEVIKK